MNVRISHTTDLEQVPAQVVELLKKPDEKIIKNSRKLDLISDLLQESKGRYAPTALDMIDELRKELAIIDQELMECQSILEGYVQVQTAPPPESNAHELSNELPSIDETFQDILTSRKAAGELPELENINV